MLGHLLKLLKRNHLKKNIFSTTISVKIHILETRALLDIGTSTNIMPYAFFNKLDLNILPSLRCIQLDDNSIVKPLNKFNGLIVNLGDIYSH